MKLALGHSSPETVEPLGAIERRKIADVFKTETVATQRKVKRL
jgi:hypothetical protein